MSATLTRVGNAEVVETTSAPVESVARASEEPEVPAGINPRDSTIRAPGTLEAAATPCVP